MQAWPRLFTNWEQAESVLWPSWHTKVPLKIARAASGHRVSVCEATSSKATRVQVQCAWSHFLGFFLVVPCSLVTVFLSVQLALTNIDHKTITANFEPLWVCIVVDTFTQVIYHNEQPRVTQYPHVAQLSCRRACSVFCKNRFSVCLLWTSHVWWCKMTRCHKSYKNGIFSIYESLVDMTRYEQDILFSLTSVWLKHYGTEKLAAETKSRVATGSWTSSTLKLK